MTEAKASTWQAGRGATGALFPGLSLSILHLAREGLRQFSGSPETPTLPQAALRPRRCQPWPFLGFLSGGSAGPQGTTGGLSRSVTIWRATWWRRRGGMRGGGAARAAWTQRGHLGSGPKQGPHGCQPGLEAKWEGEAGQEAWLRPPALRPRRLCAGESALGWAAADWHVVQTQLAITF